MNVYERSIRGILLLSFLFFFQTLFVSAQEKNTTQIVKTKSSATINGTHYYLHTVEKGQTLYAIAKFYGFEVNDIVIENPEAIDGIKPGQILKIPFEKKKVVKKTEIDTSSYILHTVEKGQTIYSITKQFNVTDEKLKALNPELLNGLKTGQVIKIPVENKNQNSEKNTSENNRVNNENKQPIVRTEKAISIEKHPYSLASDRVVKNTYSGEIKNEYNIALFLPFHADEANAIEMEKLIKGDAQLPNKSSVALEFYEGAMLAIDSLKKNKLNAKLFVYDVDDRDSNNLQQLLKKPELQSMDIIIGPLYGTSFMPVAKFAKENQIPIISPFTQLNKILFNNPYVCKISASTALQMEQMAYYVIDSFRNQNVVLVNTTSVYNKDDVFYNSFKQTANSYLKNYGVNDTLKEVKMISWLANMQPLLSTSKINVIILPSTNQSFTTDFISKLNSMRDKYKFVLFGMQAWTGYDNLDFEYLNNLNVHFPANSFVDYENPATKNIIRKYRDRYKTEPENYVFQGFDVTYYFVNQLMMNGTSFLNGITEKTFKGIQTNISLSQFVSENSGFENKSVFILRYNEFKIVKAN